MAKQKSAVVLLSISVILVVYSSTAAWMRLREEEKTSMSPQVLARMTSEQHPELVRSDSESTETSEQQADMVMGRQIRLQSNTPGPLMGMNVVNAKPYNESFFVASKERDTNIQKTSRTVDLGAGANSLDLARHISMVSEGCGQICDTSIPGHPGLFFDQIRKDVDCRFLWTNSAIDASREAGPAPNLPENLRKFYSYDGKVQVVQKRLDNRQYLDAHAMSPKWEKEQVDRWAHDCAGGRLKGNYGRDVTAQIFEGLNRMPSIAGGHVLVIGSENPWVEACILSAGARHVTTLEYGSIVSKHPQISTMTPREAREAFENKSLPLFDSIVTYSSVEHSGLGRYGDQLNPWGDLQAIARAWCVCRPGGYLLLGVMESPQDRIEWNLHRKYGPVMFPHLTSNWEQVWRSKPLSQRVYVFRKPIA